MITNRCLHCIFLLFMALLLHASLAASPSHAEITLDGTVGPSGPLSGDHFMIPAEVGRQVGGNLFHSFGFFNINADESATFTGPNSVENILGRVTGGSSSIIDGLLRSEIPGADLFLINPAGIMFGPNAQLDVQGSFHASTADFVSLGENGRFDAVEPDNSVLTVAPPSAFGFLGENPAGISVGDADLKVPKGETLSLIGGDIKITGGRLAAPSGRINIASVASKGKVVLDTSELGMDSFEELGGIEISQGANIDVSGGGGEGVFIRGGVFALSEGSMINSSTSGADPAGDIRVTVADSVSLSSFSRISSPTAGEGSSGEITITAGGPISISNSNILDQVRTSIFTNTFGKGNAGKISISSPDSSLTIKGGTIETRTFGDGHAGQISLDVGSLELSDFAVVSGDSGFLDPATGKMVAGQGRAGDITVTAADSVSLSLGSQISSSTVKGDGGTVSVTTPTTLKMDGGTISAMTAGDGNAGEITVDVGMLELKNYAQLSSDSGFQDASGNVIVGTGQAGSITVTATDSVSISSVSKISSSTEGEGHGSNISVTTPTTLKLDEGAIITMTTGEGDAGEISLKVGSLEISSGSALFANSGFYDTTTGKIVAGQGQAGNITVTAAGSVSLSSGSHISTSTAKGNGGAISVTTPTTLKIEGGSINTMTMGKGDAGEISLEVGSLELSDFAVISSDSGFWDPTIGKMVAGQGQAGNITVTVADSVSLSSGNAIISSSTKGDGNAGQITLNAESLELVEEAGIYSTSAGTGRAGDITVTTDDMITLTSKGQISSSTGGEGHGGKVSVTTPSTLKIDGGTISSATEGDGDAAEITLEVGSLELTDFAAIYSTSGSWDPITSKMVAGQGKAGKITIKGDDVITLSSGGQISASTVKGSGGKVSVTTHSTLRIDGGAIVVKTAGDGNAGEISLDVGILELMNGGKLSSDSGFQDISGNVIVGTGHAGSITVTAADSVSLSSGSQISSFTAGEGHGGNITIKKVGRLEILAGASIGTITAGSGAGGNLLIMADNLVLHNALISSGTFLGSGCGGNLTIKADSIELLEGAVIDSGTWGAGGAGGKLSITAGNLAVCDGAYINSGAFGSGIGGILSITTDTLTVRDGSWIHAGTSGSGKGGEVQLQARKIELSNGSAISAVSSSEDPEAGMSGSIVIQVDDTLQINNGSRITVETTEANGGDITVNAGFLVHLRDESAITTSVRDGEGNGGNIIIDPVFVVLDGASEVIAKAVEGNGGNITIRIVGGGAFLKSPDSIVDASSDFATSGSVSIDAPDTDISGSISTLPLSFLDVSSLLSERCVTRTAGELSTFIVVGHGGMPLSPDTPLPAFYLLDKPKDQQENPGPNKR